RLGKLDSLLFRNFLDPRVGDNRIALLIQGNNHIALRPDLVMDRNRNVREALGRIPLVSLPTRRADQNLALSFLKFEKIPAGLPLLGRLSHLIDINTHKNQPFFFFLDTISRIRDTEFSAPESDALGGGTERCSETPSVVLIPIFPRS